jgi:PAS domain S-box-containing protein
MKGIFEAIFESAPDAMIVTDLQGCIVNVNRQTRSLFGYAQNELIGKPVEILIPPSLAAQHHSHTRNYSHAPKAREMGKGLVLKAIKKDGSEFNAEISLSPISNDNPVFISAAIRDVTEKKHLLNKLQDNESQLNEQNERLKNFAYIVSHNLHSYARNFKTMLDIFEHADSTDRGDIMGHLKKNAEALNNTINDLDKIVSVHAFRGDQLEKINVKKCLEKIIEVLKSDIDNHKVLIEDSVSAEIEIEYIPAYLESIFFNLLSNGIKYRSPDRRPVINIKTDYENGRLVLEFKDNGLGIDMSRNSTKIFGMYQTFHTNADAKGLGLFITRNQVEAMGGKIELQSEPGKGTTFKIFLS